MNWRFTLIVFLVFVALATFAFLQRSAPAVQVGEGAPTATPSALYDIPPADVQEVAVVGATDGYTLTRVAGGWQVDGQAASDEVDGLVERLAKPTVVRDLPGDRKPDDYGFATPSLTVTLKTAAGAQTVVEVGDDTPADYNVYVRVKDQSRMVIVSKSDFERLKEWLTTPPLAPTATPTNTPDGTPGAGATPGTPGTPAEGAPATDGTAGTPAATEEEAATEEPEATDPPTGATTGTEAPVTTPTATPSTTS